MPGTLKLGLFFVAIASAKAACDEDALRKCGTDNAGQCSKLSDYATCLKSSETGCTGDQKKSSKTLFDAFELGCCLGELKGQDICKGVGGGLQGLATCTCDSQCTDDYVSGIVTWTVIGIVLSLLTTIAAAVPLCCGFGAEKLVPGINVPLPRVIAGLAIPVGILACFFPLIGSSISSGSTTTAMCDKCKENGLKECTDEDRETIKAVMSALGFIVAYIGAGGFAAIILGIVSSAMGCCIFCNCCKLKK